MPLEFASGQLNGRVLLLEAVSRVSRNWCPDSPNGAPLFQVWWVSLADCRPCRQKPLPRCSWSAPVPRGGCLPLSKIVYGPTVSWTLQVRKKSARKIVGRKTDRSVFFFSRLLYALGQVISAAWDVSCVCCHVAFVLKHGTGFRHHSCFSLGLLLGSSQGLRVSWVSYEAGAKQSPHRQMSCSQAIPPMPISFYFF